MNETQYTPLPQNVQTQCMGGYTVDRGKYLYEFCPYHKESNPWGYVPQHRLVVERSLGRYLVKGEYILHKDHDTRNNAIENLQVVDRAEHLKICRAKHRAEKYSEATETLVREALSKGGLKYASRVLGVSQQTIRSNFPDLVEPYKRRSPVDRDSQEFLDRLRTLAADPSVGYQEATRELGCSAPSISQALEQHNIQWVRRSRSGEVHSRYVKKGSTYQYPPELIERIRELAQSPDVSYAVAQKELHMSAPTIYRICQENGIKWIAKSNRSYPVLEE